MLVWIETKGKLKELAGEGLSLPQAYRQQAALAKWVPSECLVSITDEMGGEISIVRGKLRNG